MTGDLQLAVHVLSTNDIYRVTNFYRQTSAIVFGRSQNLTVFITLLFLIAISFFAVVALAVAVALAAATLLDDVTLTAPDDATAAPALVDLGVVVDGETDAAAPLPAAVEVPEEADAAAPTLVDLGVVADGETDAAAPLPAAVEVPEVTEAAAAGFVVVADAAAVPAELLVISRQPVLQESESVFRFQGNLTDGRLTVSRR